MSEFDKQMLTALTRTLASLKRIEAALEPLLMEYAGKATPVMPLPVGEPNCHICMGMGYKQLIDEQTDCWTTKLCECQNA